MKHLEAVILDWAGTVIDYGSVAPTTIFVEAFKVAFNFELSLAEARVPMGMGKWDHIAALGELPEVSARWQAQFGTSMNKQQIGEIYNTFMPLQKAKVVEHAMPIAGVIAVLSRLKQQGIKIGSCSGYPRQVMDVLEVAAAEYGYKPDHSVASDELAAGSRPGPWMALENVNALGINRVANCVKVDDSAPGISEGLNAGMWTIGIAITGNAVGLTEQQWQACSPAQQAELSRLAYQQLYQSGAHYVIDSLADIEPILMQIEAKLARGERP